MNNNYYCAGCLRTRTFLAQDHRFVCPFCRTVLFRAEPASTSRGRPQRPTASVPAAS